MSEEVASVVTEIGHNAGTFAVSTGNTGDDAGYPTFSRRSDSTNHYRPVLGNTGCERVNLLKLAKYHLSRDWMGRL